MIGQILEVFLGRGRSGIVGASDMKLLPVEFTTLKESKQANGWKARESKRLVDRPRA